MRRALFVILGLIAVGGVLSPNRVNAVPVTYEVSLGSFTSFQLSDLNGDTTACQINSAGDCLQQSVDEITGTIVLDDATGQILSMAYSLSGTAVVDFGTDNWNDVQQLHFFGLGYESDGPAITTLFGFQTMSGEFTSTLGVTDGSGNVSVVPDHAFDGANGVSAFVLLDTSGGVSIDISGANVGTLCDPNSPTDCGIVQANFNLTGSVAALSVAFTTSHGTTTTLPSIAVTGTVNQSATAVDVEGFAATVTGMSWSATVPLSSGSNGITATATLGAETAIDQITVVQVVNPPPPAPELPELDPVDSAVPSTVADSTAFLYSGLNPVQTGVSPGTILAPRAGVIRGRVLDGSGFPLESVAVTVVDHPEFGQTLSRADGQYDLAVNAGGALRLEYAREGLITVFRTSRPEWRDFDVLDDVVLLPRSADVTHVVTSGTDPLSVVLGATEVDALHTRQAVLLIPKGTVATAVLPGGGTTEIGEIFDVRITELTVGPLAVNARPAEMPTGGDPTNVWDVVLDQALALGSEHVEFDQPISFYVETTAAFSVGDVAPSISFDPEAGIWLDNANGVVLEIVSETGVVADLDTDGDGLADNAATLATHGITLAEQEELAILYEPGATLRRYPTTRFSSICGHSQWVPADATGPDGDSPDPAGCDCPKGDTPGTSLIRTDRQVWAEQVELTGSPYTLHYESERTPGHRAANTLTIPLTNASPPASLQAVLLEVEIAGRRFSSTYPPQANLQHVFTWDGLDAYGRTLQGRQPVRIRVDYEYQGFVDGRRSGLRIPQRQLARIGSFDARAHGLGGWSLSPHHLYDPLSLVLYRGDGGRRSGGEIPSVVVNRAGVPQGTQGPPGGTVASTRSFSSMTSTIATAPDGTFFIAEDIPVRRIHLVDPVADTITEIGTLANGNATISDLAIGPDGAVYIASSAVHVVYRMDLSGTVSVFAGVEGISGFMNDDPKPADQALLSDPSALDFGPDGSLYIADQSNNRIRRVSPDGIMHTFAGGGTGAVPGPAFDAALGVVNSLEVGDEGDVYFGESGHRVFRVNPSGYLDLFAGNGSSQANLPDPSGIGDGGAPTDASVGAPNGIAISSDGSVYISSGPAGSGRRIRRVSPQMKIETVAGTGSFVGPLDKPKAGMIARRSDLTPVAVGVLPDGTLLVVDRTTPNRQLVWSVEPALPGFSVGNHLVASRDGSEIYEFDPNGVHLFTRDALTNALLFEFEYTVPEGALAKIYDVARNETTIVRNGSGEPTAIQPPFGPPTSLSVDANRFLATISNPESETHSITSSPTGLIATFAKPGGNATTTLTYDALGRLILDEDPEGGFFGLARVEAGSDITVTTTTASGVEKTTLIVHQATGDLANDQTDPAGLVTSFTEAADGSTSVTSPDGMSVTRAAGPDPRFGMAAPIPELLEILTPAGTKFTRSQTREIETDAGTGALTRQTDTITINGRDSTVEFIPDALGGVITTETAEKSGGSVGRLLFDTLDLQGRLIETEVNGLDPVVLGYDTFGRLDSLVQGTGASERLVTFAYDTDGNLESVTDPLLRSVTFQYDLAGRVKKQILPDLREINFTYDVRGNLSTLTPPGQPAHVFLYTGLDQEEEYAPPVLPSVPSPSTTFLYDLDKNLDFVSRPDGKTIDLVYDPLGGTGRLTSVIIPRGTTTQSYDPTSGNVSSILAPGNEGLAFGYDGSLVTSTTWSGTIAGTVSQTYDDDLRVDSQTVGGSSVIFGYDNDGLLTGAGALAIVREPLNGLLDTTSLGTVTTDANFDTFGELDDDDALVGASSIYFNDYIRDKLGRITQKTETIQGATTVYTYHYEPLTGRLGQVDENFLVARVYGYDSNGNRLSVTEGAQVTSGSYDAQDRLQTYGTKTYTHNAAGDLTQVVDSALPAGQQTALYSYDALGNLTQVDLPDGRTISYVIDGQNRRVGKKVDGILVQGWLYQDQLNPVAELDGAGNVVARFVYGTRPNVPDYMVKGAVTYRIVSDHLGSPRLVIDESDPNPVTAVVQRLDYDEFGQVTQDSNVGFQPFGFAGGVYDADTGLVRFGARDYDAEVGRWTGKDPIGFGGGTTNLYAYALADPVQFIDIDGENPFLLAAAAITVAGAIGIGVPAAFVAASPVFDACDQSRFNQGAAATAAVVAGTASLAAAAGSGPALASAARTAQQAGAATAAQARVVGQAAAQSTVPAAAGPVGQFTAGFTQGVIGSVARMPPQPTASPFMSLGQAAGRATTSLSRAFGAPL